MSLKNQVLLYSLETKDFYTEEEFIINEKYFKSLRIKKRLKAKRKELEEFITYFEKGDYEFNDENSELELYTRRFERSTKNLEKLNVIVDNLKSKLNNKINSHKGIRQLRNDALRENKIVGLFESSLTRTCKIKSNTLSEEMFIIRVFHYEILKSIIENGFLHNDTKYEYLTSSAGQIRTKKIVCIKSETYSKYENSITCGLTVDKINAKGGVNTNKYQAYLALANSASNTWARFNIDRVIVVDDVQTNVFTEVDYIDKDTFEITRKEMDVPIEHMDGCGIMLPSVSKKSFMFRAPWMKGLLTPIDFIKFIKLNGGSTKIKDIYGKEYDVIEDNINIILTKSQFKMWKFYSSWDEYKENFKKYKSEACKLNVEDIGARASINYQMLQTLVSMTEDELTSIAKETINDIHNIGSDKHTMMKILGATKENQNKNPFQKAIMKYPELLSDKYSKEVLKSKKRKLVREARAGKLSVNGHYIFIIPDIYAFCEWLFLGQSNPKGLLNNNEVYTKIHNEGKVDVLRAPHLYKEHAIRNNIKTDRIEEWFITQGIYTSFHDPISKILQFDVDGDRALVIQDDTIIKVAEREMEGIVPLYYEMSKAKDELLTSDKIFTSLTSAYKANIGIISNDITKIWNSEIPNEEAVKWLCMISNFTIDFAKTLYMPTNPDFVDEELKKYSKNKLPHFFKYAKDKEDGQVNQLNNSTVNKLEYIIPDKPIRFKALVGEIDYKMLLSEDFDKIKSKKSITNRYDEINKNKRFMINNKDFNFDGFNSYMVLELLKINNDKSQISDALVEYLYSKGNKDKQTLWDCFGDIIYYNLEKNLGNTEQCELCTNRFEKKSKNKILCDTCSSIKLKMNKKKWKENNKKEKSLKR